MHEYRVRLTVKSQDERTPWLIQEIVEKAIFAGEVESQVPDGVSIEVVNVYQLGGS